MKRLFAVLSIMCLMLVLGQGTSFADDDDNIYTLTVTSSNPGSGVAITVSPRDRNERANGTTTFTRSYRRNTSVTLTAPSTANGNAFQKWTRNGTDVTTSRSTTFTMSSSRTMTAVYRTTTSDTTAPVTTASPTGGTYTGPVTVSLTRNEAGTTYYCTGSSTCTPSTTYSAPITISASTTLRYYSRDAAGNTETTKSQAYTVNSQSGNHSGLTWAGYPMCQQCHSSEVNEVLNSTHYQWKGSAAEMVNGATSQGKIAQRDASGNIIAGASAMNAYCINVLGNFPGACGSCHVGLGAAPTATNSENIDCLLCHQKDYKRVKVNGVFQPDTTMTITMDQAVRTIHKPERANCLQCHAKAGGGDAVKRGDIALASASTTDRNYDVHMASTGGNLVCQQCHNFSNHKVAGRGSDLRPLDSTVGVNCSTSSCHSGKTGTSGHSTTAVNRHVNRVACQTCHIPTYAKNANDTAATEATETHRDWRVSEYNTTLARYEPTPTKANNLKPEYRHWNGTSWGSNLKDPATYDSALGVYLISRPQGVINDTTTATKLYPFKYKTADQPYAASLNMLIALSTATYFATGNYDQAVKDGLANMGQSNSTPYSTVKTGEFQLLNHQVSPSSQALACTSCHVSGTATQMNLKNLGYGTKEPTSTLCDNCHSLKSYTSSYSNFTSIHSRHVDSKNIDCSSCHNFSRPER